MSLFLQNRSQPSAPKARKGMDAYANETADGQLLRAALLYPLVVAQLIPRCCLPLALLLGIG